MTKLNRKMEKNVHFAKKFFYRIDSSLEFAAGKESTFHN